MDRTARRRAPLALAIAATSLAAAFAAPTGEVIPVRNSVQQVFLAGSASEESTAVADYTGELLTLQAIDVGQTTAEPTIGVHPDGTAFFAGSTLVVDTPVAWGIAQTHVLRSVDGGVSWEETGLRLPRAGTPIPPGNLDPLIWMDPATGRLFDVHLHGDCSWISFSDDKGASWRTNPTASGTQGFNDHQTIGGGLPRGSVTPSGYANVLYYCVNELIRTQCGRSLDGGTVWLPTPTDPFPIGDETGCGRLVGHVETDPEGRVYVPNGGCDNPWVALSEDSGDTWSRVRVSDTISSSLGHTAIAADAAGNLYYVWLGRVQLPGSNYNRFLPFLSVSTDHGFTWGPAMMVAPPGVNNVNFPEIAGGDAGRIALTFPGTSTLVVNAQTDQDTVWNQYVVVTENALDPAPLFLSATANDPADPVHRGVCLGRCAGWWDFIDIVVSPQGEAWASGADDCVFRCVSPGDLGSLHAGRGIAIRQIGGPSLRQG